jgi:hypothetical protein
MLKVLLEIYESIFGFQSLLQKTSPLYPLILFTACHAAAQEEKLLPTVY